MVAWGNFFGVKNFLHFALSPPIDSPSPSRKMSKKMIVAQLPNQSTDPPYQMCRYRTYNLRLHRDCIQNLCNHCGPDKHSYNSQCLLQERKILLSIQSNLSQSERIHYWDIHNLKKIYITW